MIREITVSAAEMKEIEGIADQKGLSYRQMMENAGTAAFQVMRRQWPEACNIVIFAGKGNNGGDGFVIARLYGKILKQAGEEGKSDTGKSAYGTSEIQASDTHGPQITVVLCEGLPVTEDARYNFRLLSGLECVKVTTLAEYAGLQWQKDTWEDLVVDALYGTGFHGALREDGKRAAKWMNQSPAPVCALDLPSGIHADTGEAAEGAVKADLTVAFHRKKHAHAAVDAAPFCGRVVTVSIGIDDIEDA